MRQNNVEVLYVLKNDDRLRLFSEGEIKNYTQQYYQQLYLKQSLPTYEKEWSNHIEHKTRIYQENKLHESYEYNQPIQLNEVKRALSLLQNNKSEDPHTIKNEFLKYEGEAIEILLKDYFQQILLRICNQRMYQLSRTHQL